MSRKRKGKYTLTEALDIVSEATTAQDYPDDGSAIAGDDDRPPGNIVFGQKYKRTSYFNKLTDYQERIISTIKEYPKINQKELAKRTGINRITLSNNLKKLMSLCMVRKIPNGNKVYYEYIDNKQLL